MFVSVDRAELFYSIRGQGPVCLVLSAIGLTSYLCLEVLRRRILFWSETDQLTGL